MQPTDKFRSDLDQTLKRSRGTAGEPDPEKLRDFFFRYFPKVADETKAALFASFLEAWRTSPERAVPWLAGVGSILLMDYDGTSFTPGEWAELRESLTLAQDELDIDLLGYAMSLIVDHGAL
ncbi:MAG: hypothetical protein ACLQMF_08085 [Rectinemataceae bacterium]